MLYPPIEASRVQYCVKEIYYVGLYKNIKEQ